MQALRTLTLPGGCIEAIKGNNIQDEWIDASKLTQSGQIAVSDAYGAQARWRVLRHCHLVQNRCWGSIPVLHLSDRSQSLVQTYTFLLREHLLCLSALVAQKKIKKTMGNRGG